ncbi:Tim10/DDP family zinc finger protein [Melampsora americana]|nr:Tim10/DDP family zinc finger protein [Melampsora americana]
MDASKFNSKQSEELNQLIEKKQMKDFLKLYSGLVERCFMNCCQDFTSRSLSTKEETCVNNCTDKFLKHSERVGARFSEHNAEMMEKQSKLN